MAIGLATSSSFSLLIQPRLKAIANIAVDNFAFKDVASVRSLRIQGELPTSETIPTLLAAKIDHLRSGNREIENATVNLAGTRKAHVLKVESKNRQSNFYLQLAGGFNSNNEWLGQLQKGNFASPRINLVQNQNAAIVYSTR